MNSEKDAEIPSTPKHDLVWIISEAKLSEIDLNKIDGPAFGDPVKAYHISDLANYLLNPNPVQVKKKLIGCEIHRTRPLSVKIKDGFRKFFSTSPSADSSEKDTTGKPEILILESRKKAPDLKDKDLESHFDKIDELLRPYDSTIKHLLNMDKTDVSTMFGICEDMDGNRSLLNLQGYFFEQTKFLIDNMNKDVGVLLNTAQIADGLFDMGGIDFTSYDPERRHRLIRFDKDGETKFCILGTDDKVSYWIEDIKLLRLLHLLDQSIRNNFKLKESLQQCIEGEAKPLKLFFNKELEIDYTGTRPPEVYRQVFERRKMKDTERNFVIGSLKNFQFGVSLNYILKSDSGKEKLCTSMSVMHDIRALDPIKDIVPEVYTEINKRTQTSEAGRFYLLDAIRGYRNEQ
jgi:hypothetical protein